MKIKAIYEESGELCKEVLIVGFTEGLVVCLDKYGNIFFTDKDNIQVIDKDYLDLLRENNQQ